MTMTDDGPDVSDEVAGGDPEDFESEEPDGLEGLRDHIVRRTVVLPEQRVLFVPTPKAACTSILWQLARLGGQPLDRFEESGLSEVSPSLTVHDMSRWEAKFRFGRYSADERARILADDGWFRFTVVRDPASRVWSAWQSKLLLREPRFVAEWGQRSWFPRAPQQPEQVLKDFRAFVAALADPEVDDVHWTSQTGLLADLPLTHIGRTEALAETMTALQAHLARVGHEEPLAPGRDNRSPLPMPPAAYDAAAAAVLNQRYADDQDRFGYPPVAAGDDAANGAWAERVAPVLPLLAEIIERNARVGQLAALAQERGQARRQIAHRLYQVERRLQSRGGRRSGSSPDASAPVLVNREGRSDYTVRWAWDEGPLPPGFTAVVRVKNESRPLPFVLPPLLRALHHVVLVDNGSTDGTPELAVEIARREGRAERLRVVHYPFEVARCGPEHLATPPDSLRSLTYFYNWSFSQVRTAYALKWDGDMVLTETGVKALQDLDWQLEATQRIITMLRYPLYVADERTAFLDLGLANSESWGWPNRPGYAHVKAIDWELPVWPAGTRQISLPDWSCVELKWLDADEFAHWSTTDFAASARTQRKHREYQVHRSLAAGTEPPEGVIRIDAPAGSHVVDFVRETWILAERPRLVRLAHELQRARRLAAAPR